MSVIGEPLSRAQVVLRLDELLRRNRRSPTFILRHGCRLGKRDAGKEFPDLALSVRGALR